MELCEFWVGSALSLEDKRGHRHIFPFFQERGYFEHLFWEDFSDKSQERIHTCYDVFSKTNNLLFLRYSMGSVLIIPPHTRSV